ncbi:MAG TPA: phospholipase [Spirochaetia bacterium]|nr:phospholipase [Spirochaetia bacterium]
MTAKQTATGPHSGMPVLSWGSPLASANAAMIMMHGRGASAEDILGLAPELQAPSVAFLAPQAAGHTWYPYPFLSAIERNEPGISSALSVLAAIDSQVVEAGIPSNAVFILGFSQGACLALEYGARNARRFGGIIGLSGGLIGPDGTPRDYSGSMDGAPAFLGCSDIDPHIPKARVQLSADVFRRLGGSVTERIYSGMGHTINDDELEAVRSMLRPFDKSKP